MKSKSYNYFFLNFANKTKFDIIIALKEKPLNVTQIVKKVNKEQSAVSHNLKSLTRCNILTVKQKGKEHLYSLNKETVLPMLNLADKHVKCFCPICRKNE